MLADKVSATILTDVATKNVAKATSGDDSHVSGLLMG